MKKRIVIALAAFMLVVMGGFIFNKIAGAENFTPNIEFETDSPDIAIKSFVGTQFEIPITIKPGDMKYVNTAPPTSNNVENVYIEVKPLAGLEFKGVKVGDKVINAIEGKVSLDDIKYKDVSTNSGWKTVAEPINIKLIYTSLKDGEFDGVGEINLLYKENERAINPKQITKKLAPSNKPSIEVGKLQFTTEPKFEKAGLIYNNSEVQYPTKENPLEVGLNRYFEIDYNINAGALGVVSSLDADGEMKILSDVDINSDRNLIYVVDKGAINLKGGNEELAKESINKALEELKVSNPDIKTSLVVYGEKAEIITVDDKDILSLDQLISQINDIEVADKSGNLGDAIRKAKYLANKNDKANSSIVIVSAGNPNYYTKLSEGNNTLLESRSSKDGFVEEDKKIAEEYVNNIINDIAVNELDETRWYGVNYGIEEQQLLLNNCIDKLDGIAPQVKNPYYDNFVSINTSAITPIKIKAILEIKSKDGRIEIHPEDIKKEFEFSYSQNDDSIEVLKSVENFRIRAKITELNDTSDIINIISTDKNEGVEAILNIKIDGQTKTYKFNENKDLELYTKVTIPYIAKVGLYNGKQSGKFGGASKNTNLSDVIQFNNIANEFIEDVPSPQLAIENYYSFAALIKSDSSNKVKLFYDVPLVAGETIKGKVYEVLANNDSFTIDKNNVFELNDIITKKQLEAGKIYLVVIDDYIETNKLDINGVGKSFDIGVSVFDSQTNNTDSNKEEVWTIKVNPVAKPEHF